MLDHLFNNMCISKQEQKHKIVISMVDSAFMQLGHIAFWPGRNARCPIVVNVQFMEATAAKHFCALRRLG